MKKFILPILLLSLLAACGSGGDKKTGDKSADEKKDDKPATTDLSSNPDYQKGLDLIAGSDCFTCHKVEEKFTGPSYKEVANKYASSDTAIAYLSAKIIKGGGGVWGSTPMSPHSGISQADAEAMAKYILLLKTK